MASPVRRRLPSGSIAAVHVPGSSVGEATRILKLCWTANDLRAALPFRPLETVKFDKMPHTPSPDK